MPRSVMILLFAAFSLLALGIEPGQAAKEPQVAMCHCPAGNPDNCHAILVSAAAATTHLQHGDYYIGLDYFSSPLMEVVEGLAGNALTFDGVTDRMQVPHSSSLQFSTDSITALMWIKPDVGDSGWRTLLSKGSEWPIPLYLSLFDNQVFLTMAGPLDSTWVTDVTVPPDEWTSLAVRYAPGAVQLFKDGVLVDQHPAFGSLALSGNTDPLFVGFNTLWPEEVFDGLVDEVHLFDRALTDSEIALLHANPGGPVPIIDEVARFSMDALVVDGAIQKVEDLSPNHNDGILNLTAQEAVCD